MTDRQILTIEMALGFERMSGRIDQLSNKIDHIAGEVATLKILMENHMRDHHSHN